MFLLIFGRPVDAHPDGLLHGVSTQMSLNLGKTFLRMVSYMKNCTGLNLGEGICVSHFPDSGLYRLNGFDFDPCLDQCVKLKPSNSISFSLIFEQPTVDKPCSRHCIFSIREITFLSLNAFLLT